MPLRTLLALAIIAGTALTAPPVRAHHGTNITYWGDRSITLSGVVTEVALSYPHSQIYFDVKKPDGKVEKWGSELGAPVELRKYGWKSIKAGDQIVITCAPHKEPGATACLGREIRINGKLMAMNEEQAKKAATEAGGP